MNAYEKLHKLCKKDLAYYKTILRTCKTQYYINRVLKYENWLTVLFLCVPLVDKPSIIKC